MAHDSDGKPSFDPQLHRDVVDSFARGRKPESYKQCLENHGFTWYPHNIRSDGTPEPQWRNARIRAAFNEQDLVTQFPSPEDLDRWIRSWKASRKGQGLSH